jgi:outer membrane protein TolC
MHLKPIVCLLPLAAALSLSAQTNSTPLGGVSPAAGVTTNTQPLTATNFVAAGLSVTNGVLAGTLSNNVPPTSILGTNFIVRPISLADAVQLALRNNYDVQIIRYNPDIARFNLEATYGAYEPSLSGSAGYSYYKSPPGVRDLGNGILFTVPGTETERDSYDIGVGGVAPTGLQYGLDSSLSHSQVQGPLDVNSSWTFNLRQPLLRNMWIDGTRRDILVNKKRLKISEWQLRETLINTIASVENGYYNLIQSRENIKVQRAALEYANQLLRENKTRVEVGALAPRDEKQAEAEVARAVSDLLVTEQSYAVALNAMKNLITQDFANWTNIVLDPIETLVAVPATPTLAESWRRGLTMRPDLQELKLNMEAQDITIKYLKNQLWPQLDLQGSYGHAASDPRFQGAFNQMIEDDNPHYTIGAVLDIPLGNRTTRYNLKAAKASSAQLLLQYKQLEQNVMVAIDDAIKLLQSRFQQVEASRQARLFAQDALSAEQKKYENGKSTSFLVLQAQRDLTARRFEEIQALADYNKALSGLSQAEGATLERNNLNLTVQ